MKTGRARPGPSGPCPGPDEAGRHPWVEWGGSGPVLHLAHANGFPPGTYRRLATGLATRFTVCSMGLRPLVPGADPGRLARWEGLADDLRRELRGRGLTGVVGAGHSVGAVSSMMASVADPGLFRALVLIDPVLFTGPRARVWGWMKRLGLSRRLPIVRGALRRRDRWPSREEVAASYRGKPLFATWDPGCLDDYLDAGLVPCRDGGVALRYPTNWEARIFETSPHDPWPLVARIRVPTLVLRGGRSDAFTAEAAARFARLAPAARIEEVPDTTHLLAMEQPEEVGTRILAFLATL